jgi:tRNA (guanine37-N1)-methyltransferase
MRFDVVTLFPEMFPALTQWGITGRACEQGLASVNLWNPRDYCSDPRKTVDDRAYGGGPGMVMMAKPLEDAISAVKLLIKLKMLLPGQFASWRLKARSFLRR